MSKSRLEYGHVTFPLSLTEEEKIQYAEFCKNKGETMSGRIKSLMQKDMGMTVLSSFKERYQLNMIDTIKKNKKVLIVKSRQMLVSQMLLSIALDCMLTEKKKEKGYTCLFVTANMENAKSHLKRFVQICSDNGIKLLSIQEEAMQLTIMNGAIIKFMSGKKSIIGGNIIIFDEAAFIKMTADEFQIAMDSSPRAIISSTPTKGSVFNELAKESVMKRSKYVPFIAHWMMNSLHSDDVVAIPRESEGKIVFDIVKDNIMQMMLEKRYSQEMDCTLL